MSVAVLPILELPHPTLRQRARKVRKIGPKTLRLAYDLIDTMRDAGGVGLAANQVGSLQRVIVVQLPEEDEAAEEARIYVNPEIVHREGQREVEEACLSVPGYKGFINRSVWVKFSALDHTSRTVKLKAEELLAQALEHEVDHLNGILYLDHLESHDRLVKVEPESEQTAEGPQPGSNAVPAAEAASDTPATLKVR
jgi:peptide deformylase